MPGLTDRLVSSWSRRGALAWSLLPVAGLMWLVVWLRRQAFRFGALPSQSVGLPVVVVGNRIVGGAGKTPTSIAIIKHLQSAGWHPGVLSRGYRRQKTAAGELTLLDQHTAGQLDASLVGDEPLLIWRRTQAPMMIGRDRVRAGKALKESHPGVDILVCDDGLQHLRLHRDIEVIVFDERGAGNGWLLPAGPLREPLHSPESEGLAGPPLVLYNANRPSTALPGFCAARRLGRMVPLADWWHPKPKSMDGKSTDEPPTSGAWAVAGIAHPPKFFDQLAQQGFEIHPVPCPDHADYAAELPWPPSVHDVIVTEKDAIKLHPERVAAERPLTRVWVATLDFEPDTGFWGALDFALSRLTPRPPN